jgi:hypothetical protein
MTTHASSEFLGNHKDIKRNDIRKENISKLKSINDGNLKTVPKMTIIGCNAGS